MSFHLTIEAAKTSLEKETNPFVVLMKEGSMSVEYFVPKEMDIQTPHKQDEIYVIASGNSLFNRNGEMVNCKAGDVLFVTAGMKHRFENFSVDFATWVIFYGREESTRS